MTTVQGLFLVLWAAFYGAYMLKMLLLRQQGIRADILGKGEKPKGRAALETAMKAVTYLGAAVQAFSIAFPEVIWSFTLRLSVRKASSPTLLGRNI